VGSVEAAEALVHRRVILSLVGCRSGPGGGAYVVPSRFPGGVAEGRYGVEGATLKGSGSGADLRAETANGGGRWDDERAA
jgi:hypothetical protein